MSVKRPPDPFVREWLALFRRVRPTSNGWFATCPSHDDRNPSLSIGLGRDGRVLLNCHAGCPTTAVVAAVGRTMADLYPGPKRSGTRAPWRPGTAGRGPLVLRERFTLLLGELPLAGSHRQVGGELARVMDANGVCEGPSLSALVKRTSLHRATVCRALLALEAVNAIVRLQRDAATHQTTVSVALDPFASTNELLVPLCGQELASLFGDDPSRNPSRRLRLAQDVKDIRVGIESASNSFQRANSASAQTFERSIHPSRIMRLGSPDQRTLDPDDKATG